VDPSKTHADDGEYLESGAILYITKDRGVDPEAGEAHLLDCLRKAPLLGWSIFVQPHLNGERPDFVLTHPERGIVVIEVKDYNARMIPVGCRWVG
jgi:Nuclease-related domain